MQEQQLAHALQAGDFETANRLSEEYGRSVLAQLRATPSPQARELIFRRAVENLNGYLSLARVLRAHIAARFSANSGQWLYQGAAPDRHCWDLEA